MRSSEQPEAHCTQQRTQQKKTIAQVGKVQ